jgi:Ser/Thr protein kinase RdoA (MazF antagonist)
VTRTPATIEHAREALAAGWPALGDVTIEPLGRGLINDTFAVDAGVVRGVLQRVHPVFAPEIHWNILAVTEHLHDAGITTPRLVPTGGARPWHTAQDGVWRVTTRVPGVTFDSVQDPAQAHAAARLLARFHSALDSLAHTFVGMRSGVHDTPAHLRRLRAAVQRHAGHRLHGSVAALADAIESRAAELPSIAGVRPRIAHGDPKLNNVMFRDATERGRHEAVCMIDLDTVGPLSLPYELGDAWRSWCNPAGEDDVAARFDLAIFEASVAGYREGCTLVLAPEEREALLHGVEWITLELASRFATDALEEAYFGWDRARFPAAGEHNLVRARGQWSLHEAVMAARHARAAVLARG